MSRAFTSCAQRRSRRPTAASRFLSGTICDRTGSVEIKVWDYSGPIGARADDAGRVVKIRGSVSEYRGALQVSVHRIRMAEAADTYDKSLLVPTAPIDADAALRGRAAAGRLDRGCGLPQRRRDNARASP
ncbi:MAG: OB-fold nucleic acid binding domain-containing protein [Oscillospiraceae bacterium]